MVGQAFAYPEPEKYIIRRRPWAWAMGMDMRSYGWNDEEKSLTNYFISFAVEYTLYVVCPDPLYSI